MKTARMLSSNKGVALVEFAIVVTLFVVLLFGIIEFGLLIKDRLTISQAARVGARIAAVGSPTTDVKDAARASAFQMNIDADDILVEKAPASTPPLSWGGVADVQNPTDGKYYNDAESGNMIRVTVPYKHTLITSLFSPFFHNSSTVTLTGEMIMRRE